MENNQENEQENQVCGSWSDVLINSLKQVETNKINIHNVIEIVNNNRDILSEFIKRYDDHIYRSKFCECNIL